MDELVKCHDCAATISGLADVCPQCFAQIDRTRTEKLSTGAKVGIAATAVAVAAGSSLAMLGGLSMALSGGAIFAQRKGFKSKNKDVGAIDFFMCSFGDTIGEIAITPTDFVCVISLLGFPKIQSTIPRSSVVKSYIDENHSKTKLFGGEKVTVMMELNTKQLKPLTLVYVGKDARSSANEAVAKFNHYATGNTQVG